MFTVCPTSPVKLKLYSMASSEMAEPKATDNSGLVTITVSPSWFHRDIRLAESLNVTYTAHDGAGRTSTCYVTIEVNGEGFSALSLSLFSLSLSLSLYYCVCVRVCVCVCMLVRLRVSHLSSAFYCIYSFSFFPCVG